jgi:hypothetical protein
VFGPEVSVRSLESLVARGQNARIPDPEKISVLEFINRVRGACGKEPFVHVPLLGTRADDEEGDVLAAALELSVGRSNNKEWAARDGWVMRFDDVAVAKRVAHALGVEWVAEPPEVRLPDALVDLSVSQHYAVVEDEEGWLRGWWIPDANGLPEFCTPHDPLVDLRGDQPGA